MVQESTNTFSDGLISDLNPLTTPNTVLTDALNATLLTFNGNELVLQNDMGNAKIEGCKLSEGFIPLGIKEHGGILYIVSTDNNPIESERLVQIGSFPSPSFVENDLQAITVTINIDATDSEGVLNKNIQLSKNKLYPGDKFIVFLNIPELAYVSSPFLTTPRKFYKFKLLSIEKGIETDLTSTLINQPQYVSENVFTDSGYWFVPGSYPTDAVVSNYRVNKKTQIYKLRKSGKLYLRIETETIDEFIIKNIGPSIYPILQIKNESDVIDGNFYLNFNIYIKALSQIKVDTVEINLNIIDLLGISPDRTVTKIASISDFNGDDYQLNNVLLNVGSSNDIIVTYTIKCRNLNYEIDFNNYIIDTIDLSIDPSQWANSSDSDYEFYDYDLFDYQTI